MLQKYIDRLLSSRTTARQAGRPSAASSIQAETQEPLIFFVHVPKTAGSTVNHYLHQFLPNGFSHCESFFNITENLNYAVKYCGWLSGHIDFGSALSIFDTTTDRQIRYFACMRNPSEQVMSHYNWLFEIFHRGKEFYEAHPREIMDMSEVIRSSPKTAASIAANIERFGDLFLNLQSRYVLGYDFNWNTAMLHQRLDRYEMIVDSNGLPALLSRLLGSSIDFDRRENVSPYHFDPAVFATDEMREFLRTRNTLDEIVYGLLDRGGRGSI